MFIALVAIGLLIFLGIIFAGTLVADQLRRNNPFKEVNLDKGGKTNLLAPIIKEDLSKYDKDTDNDGYPDFIEQELGLDPNQSEFVRCGGGKGCADPTLTNTAQSKKNVIIILDASGSMGLTIGGQTRMDAAKAAIKNYVSQAASDTNISLGLMVYGHKGSNSQTDKPISCAAAEVIAAIGTVNSSTIDSYLATIQPTGWTPMGLAITNAQAAFTGKDGERNEIILVTDGDETCDSNPIGAAGNIHNSAAKVTVNVIGFAVSAAEQATLNGIASAGGGSFTVASDSSELIRVMSEKLENLKKLTEQTKCETAAYGNFLTCESDTFNKVYDYINKKKSTYYKKEITKAEFDRLTTLGELVFQLHDERREKGVNASR
ncbi:TPA: hypothetical protein DIS61_05920 [Patescibacteria group bacterium]|nr:MAG: hypothetical protein A2699_04830 [Candidatus Gottesmanbacteria bacterium RIFCSPHIGHO2_01_FULL_43_15]OGG27902.1 MAG: hypothetical protein A3A59_00965 [Candidatus Gottesmanbacteria bacterium RIFCSPLOWO2_01_FULL_42_10]HCM38163.1 hypothetical protein [Patescibacteria group bacterium]